MAGGEAARGACRAGGLSLRLRLHQAQAHRRASARARHRSGFEGAHDVDWGTWGSPLASGGLPGSEGHILELPAALFHEGRREVRGGAGNGLALGRLGEELGDPRRGELDLDAPWSPRP
jgi:hypothetical protein